MSAHHILGLEQVPRVGCSPFKVVRELGSERRDSSVPICRGLDIEGPSLVREDRVDVPLVYRL